MPLLVIITGMGCVIEDEGSDYEDVMELPVNALHFVRDKRPRGKFWRRDGINRLDAGVSIADDKLYKAITRKLERYEIDSDSSMAGFDYDTLLYRYIVFSTYDYNRVMNLLRIQRPEDYGFDNRAKLCTANYEYYKAMLRSMLKENIDHTFSVSNDGNKSCIQWHSRYDKRIAELSYEYKYVTKITELNQFINDDKYDAWLYFFDNETVRIISMYMDQQGMDYRLADLQHSDTEYIYMQKSYIPEVVGFSYIMNDGGRIEGNFDHASSFCLPDFVKGMEFGAGLVNSGIDHIHFVSDHKYCFFWLRSEQQHSL